MARKANPHPSPSSRTGLLACLLALLPCLAAAADAPRQNAGPYLVTLRLPPDGLYAQEEMQIEFRIEDTTRPDPLTVYTAVIRATPEAVIDMPAMAGMPPFTEIAHAEGTPGDYGIHPTFAHGGEFRLRLTVQPGAIAEFPLTVLDSAARRKRLPPRYTLELTTDPKKPKAGEPVEFRLTVRDRDNRNAPVPALRRHAREASAPHPGAPRSGPLRPRTSHPWTRWRLPPALHLRLRRRLQHLCRRRPQRRGRANPLRARCPSPANRSRPRHSPPISSIWCPPRKSRCARPSPSPSASKTPPISSPTWEPSDISS